MKWMLMWKHKNVCRSREVVLETKDNTYYHFKTDIFKREITYSTDKSFAANLVTISANRAFDVINMNKKGMKPVTLEADTKPQPPKRDAQDILGQDSVTRFDASLKKKKKKRNGNGNKENLPKETVANTGSEGNSKPTNGEKANGNNGNENKNGKGNGNRNGNRNRNNGTGTTTASGRIAKTTATTTVTDRVRTE